MISEFEIERAVAFVYLSLDWKISEDVRTLDNSGNHCRTNKIFSPFGKEYIESWGRDKYGSIEPMEISIINLNKMARCTNYIELANNKTFNMHSPIDIAYYFQLCGVWTFLHTAESYTHHLDGTPNCNRSQFYASQAKRYIRVAIDDIINNDLGGDDTCNSDDLSNLIQQQIIMYLYCYGSFRDVSAPTSDEDLSNYINEGCGDADLMNQESWNYPQPSIDEMNQQTGESNA